MYLLDTNVVSELRKPRPHGAILAWLRSRAESELHISAVTLGAIQAGLEITREQDAARAAEVETWAGQVAAPWNVLPMDAGTFRGRAKLIHHRSDARILRRFRTIRLLDDR